VNKMSKNMKKQHWTTILIISLVTALIFFIRNIFLSLAPQVYILHTIAVFIGLLFLVHITVFFIAMLCKKKLKFMQCLTIATIISTIIFIIMMQAGII